MKSALTTHALSPLRGCAHTYWEPGLTRDLPSGSLGLGQAADTSLQAPLFDASVKQLLSPWCHNVAAAGSAEAWQRMPNLTPLLAPRSGSSPHFPCIYLANNISLHGASLPLSTSSVSALTEIFERPCHLEKYALQRKAACTVAAFLESWAHNIYLVVLLRSVSTEYGL